MCLSITVGLKSTWYVINLRTCGLGMLSTYVPVVYIPDAWETKTSSTEGDVNNEKNLNVEPENIFN